MEEKFIYLIEKYFDNELTPEENRELSELIENNPQLKDEFNEQKRIKEVLKKMHLKNPSKEFWDSYWTGGYNRFERNIAWIAIIIGSLILFGYGSVVLIDRFFADNQLPQIVKIGIGIFTFGFIVLLFSLIREKIATSRKDIYKEIQR